MKATTRCELCNGEIGIDSTQHGREIICPHCESVTVALAKVDYDSIPRTVTARIVRKTEVIGTGCFVQGLGFLLLFVFPIGTVIGVFLLLWGGRLAIKYQCGNCNNPVVKNSKLCPSCKAALT